MHVGVYAAIDEGSYIGAFRKPYMHMYTFVETHKDIQSCLLRVGKNAS